MFTKLFIYEEFLNVFLYVALTVCKVWNLQFKQIDLADSGTQSSYENEKDNFKEMPNF